MKIPYKKTPALNEFKTQVSAISIPDKFTNPFCYEPDELSKIAVKELQEKLGSKDQKGKMFGILVVRTTDNKIGYLAATSGNSDLGLPVEFVPPVFDLYDDASFYRKGEKELTDINNQIAKLENSTEYNDAINRLKQIRIEASNKIYNLKKDIKRDKVQRKKLRKEAETSMISADYEKLDKNLTRESVAQKGELTRTKKYWNQKISEVQTRSNTVIQKFASLKNKRKSKSAQLQQKLFEHYSFLNADGESKNLIDIFSETEYKVPPSAAGDCSAPKLLHYAYKHNLKPIAMAEFWWGLPPKSEIRKHGNFYPACQLKCKPILGHMLKGLDVYEDRFAKEIHSNLSISIVYEDDSLAVVNKPSGLLSVPGKTTTESVYSQAKEKYPDATGPLIVHRLDMATSGLMLIAKTKDVHKHLQQQFLDHTIQKRYMAVLDGNLKENEGKIELPLRVDLNDRPRQVVCYEHGKPGKTIWKVIERKDNRTRVHFFPITGRTHQLRVHSAHHKGLNTPIVGDELYGTKDERLCLHAESIKFIHPVSGKTMSFKVDAQF